MMSTGINSAITGGTVHTLAGAPLKNGVVLVRDGKIEPRLMLPLALSYDHRVADGANAARFIVDLVKELETFKEEDVKL